MGGGLVAVGLCGEFFSAIEAFICAGIKIGQLYVYKIDPEARTLATARPKVLSKMFFKTLPKTALARCFSVLPQDIAMIKYRQEVNWGLWTRSFEGFHVKGFLEQP
jgi:hypothetical protein